MRVQLFATPRLIERARANYDGPDDQDVVPSA